MLRSVSASDSVNGAFSSSLFIAFAISSAMNPRMLVV